MGFWPSMSCPHPKSKDSSPCGSTLLPPLAWTQVPWGPCPGERAHYHQVEDHTVCLFSGCLGTRQTRDLAGIPRNLALNILTNTSAIPVPQAGAELLAHRRSARPRSIFLPPATCCSVPPRYGEFLLRRETPCMTHTAQGRRPVAHAVSLGAVTGLSTVD